MNNSHNGFKRTRHGLIPSSWRNDKLANATSFLKDGTHFSPQSNEGPFRYITSKNIRFGKLDLSNCSNISAEDHERIFGACAVRQGDVLLTKDGANTGNATLNTLEEPFSLLSSVAVLRGESDHLLNEFLLQFILSPRGQYAFTSEMAGQAITRLTLTTIGQIEVPLPPLPEQQKIAAILSTWDQAIELTEKLIAAKQKRKQALMQQLLTGFVRLPEFKQNKSNLAAGIVRVPAAVRRGLYPPSVQPGIPKITYRPDGWDEITMDKLIHIEKRPIELNDDEEYQLVVAKRNRGGIEPREILRGHEVKTPTQFEVRAGDFVISKRQIIHGACGVVPDSLDGAVVSGEYSVCTVNSSLDMEFLKYLSHTLYFQQTCFHASVGVALEKMIFRLEQWLKFPFLIPSIDEQQAIVSVLAAMDKELDLLMKRATLLSRQKKGLMQQLLTGKVRVNMENEK